ncbi:DUF4097 family beta strand repeat-containing protein [Aquisalibacillus elongatus]|uniref:Putative adhesin n=1 Tax=Aquisalibacillus elongatus TaxID=485577 RepID=A0A3N5B8B8_9BACI|nr:DUF4097 family beta strand repeat-containing protein [Aquisalibacillus elongatus]RPF53986.1 putative adhesin [Aquisalibacillus elongatus]
MKRVAIISVIILFVSLIGLTVTVAINGGSIKGMFLGKSEKIEEQKTFESQEIDRVNIEANSSKLNILPTDGNEITVDYYGEKYVFSDSQFKVNQEGNQLNVDLRENQSFFWFNIGNRMNLDVYLPEKIYDAIQIDLSAATVSIDNIQVRELGIDTSAGKVDLTSIDSEKSAIDTSAGAVTINRITGDLDIDTSAGKVVVDLESLEQNINVDTSAGQVIINTVEQPTDMVLDYRASAGSASIDFPLNYEENSGNRIKGSIGEGIYRVDVNTSAGSFEFNTR